MRVILAILVALMVGAEASSANTEESFHTVFWKNRLGQVVYEGRFEVCWIGAMPMLQLVESYRHGPFVYKALAPRAFDHGHGIMIRNYLPQPTLCWVPPGYKVSLQRATVPHGPVKMIPYLYLGELEKHCLTELSSYFRPVFYKEAPLVPVRQACLKR